VSQQEVIQAVSAAAAAASRKGIKKNVEGSKLALSVEAVRDNKDRQVESGYSQDYKAMTANAWILGGGWDENKWGGMLPDKSWLDKASKGQQYEEE
jgi:predicted amidohydrolase YtcJ